jgi:hypothetical protein
MKLLVQKFLETNSFKELQEQHGVYASFSKSGHKFSLNYDQIEAKEADPLSQECRGLILALPDGSPIPGTATPDGKINRDNVTPGSTKILAYPMKRFFNYGQGSAAAINWSDPNLGVLEKLDGTLCIVYYDFFISKWCVATRSVPEADIVMDNNLFTFRTLFEKAFEETVRKNVLHYDSFENFLYGNFSQNFTYCFELTTPYNRIVVDYQTNGVTLLAARHMPDLQEVDFTHRWIAPLSKYFPFVQAHTYTSVGELVDWVSTLNPMAHEGVVVRDAQFNRIKIKNAAYVAASKIRESLATSPRNCLELILLGKDDDAASFLPQEIQDNLVILKEKFVFWLKKQEDLAQVIIEEAKSLGTDKKTFAVTVQKYQPDLPAALYNIYSGRATSIKTFIESNRKDGTWSNSFLDKLLSVI